VAGNDQHFDGRTGSPRPSNVVHLRPRQWLESDEELVPIGEAPNEPSGDPVPPAGHASTWLGGGEETIPIGADPACGPDVGDSPKAWAASDFWGEDAAQVHDALEAPVPEPHAAEVAASDSAPPAFTRRLVRVPAALAITVAAAAIIAAAISSFGSRPAAPRQVSRAASVHATTGARPKAPSVAPQSPMTAAVRLRLTAAARQARSAKRAHLRAHPRSAPAPRVPATRRHQHRNTVAAATAVRYVTPTPTTTSAPTSSPATQATSRPAPSPPGPTGTVSLIGAGTSSSG
jgi:hypothetical protein